MIEGAGMTFCYRCLAGSTLDFIDNPLEGSPPEPPELGTPKMVLGEYELLDEIARGGMGLVYRARRQSTNQLVALKLIHSGPYCSLRTEARFMTEIEAAATLSHPNIVPIIDVRAHEEQPFYTMTLVEGGTLQDTLGERLDWAGLRKSVLRMVKIARAVHFAHEHGIIHRDLKPSNVLLDPSGEPHVSDFGLAKRLEDQTDLTLSWEVLGTPAYMAPEQAAGPASNQTILVDVYSLGAVLFEVVTGNAPFRGHTALEVLKKIETEDVQPPSRLQPLVDRDLETIVLKCLEKAPEDRYSSALALAEDLERWLAREPVLARPLSGIERSVRWCRRRPYLVASIGVLILSLGIIGAQAWRNHLQSEREQAKTREVQERLAHTLEGVRLEQADALVASARPGAALAHIAANLRDGIARPGTVEWLRTSMEATSMSRRMGPLLKHEDQVWCAAFHPNGRWLVTGCNDGFVYLWDIVTGKRLSDPMELGAQIYFVDVDSTGKYAIAGSYEGYARIWELETAKPVTPMIEHKGGVHVAHFDREAPVAFTAGTDRVARVWDLEKGAVVVQEFRHPEEDNILHLVKKVPGTDWLMTGSVVGNIRVWERSTGQLVEEFHAQAPYLSNIVFNPSGERFVTLGTENARLWDTATWTPIAVLAHEQSVWTVVFDPHGGTMITGSREDFKRWRVEDGQPESQRTGLESLRGVMSFFLHFHPLPKQGQFVLRHGSRVLALGFDGRPSGIGEIGMAHDIRRLVVDPKKNRVAVFNIHNTAEVWEIGSPVVRSHHGRTPPGERWDRALILPHRDGSASLAVGRRGQAEVRVHAIEETGLAKSPRRFALESDFNEFAPIRIEGKLFLRDRSSEGGVVLVDVEGGRHHRFDLVPVSWRIGVDRASRSFVAYRDPSLWPSSFSLESGKEDGGFKGAGIYVEKLDFGFRDRQVALGSAEGVLSLWDRETYQMLEEYRGSPIAVTALVFSPTESRLVVGRLDGSLSVWRTDLEWTPRWTDHESDAAIDAVAFSNDGLRVAVGSRDGWIRTFLSDTGQSISRIHHGAPIIRLAWLPGSERMMVVSSDSQVRFWDADSGLPLSQSIPVRGDPSLAWLSPDGKYFSSGTVDGGLSVRRVPDPVTRLEAPGWLPAFAEAVGGFRLIGDDRVEVVPWPERRKVFESVSQMDASESLVRWAQSLLVENHWESE